LDVTDKAALDATMFAFGKQTENRLGLMFNNAGIAFEMPTSAIRWTDTFPQSE
jgi:NADP-dependent 3-hydroxy acid dehydrogenase YdfG